MPHSSIVINKKPRPIETTSYQSTGSDFLQSSSSVLGTGAIWTIALWQRRTTPGQGNTNIFFTAEADDDSNKISWIQNTDVACILEIRSPSGSSSTTKTYQYLNLNTAVSGVAWEHIVLVYNDNGGSSDTLLTYYNGVDITEKITSSGPGDPRIIKLADSNPGQTDTARKLTIGGGMFGNWSGNQYNWGMWDVNLSAAAILDMYNGGLGGLFDLNKNKGNYVNSADLQHLYRFDDSGDRGKDLGNAATLKDIDVEASGTNTFITDFPGI